MDLREIQELTDTTPEGLTEDDLLETSAFSPCQAVRKQVSGEQGQKPTGITPPGRSLPSVHGPFYDTGTETTVNKGRRVGTI